MKKLLLALALGFWLHVGYAYAGTYGTLTGVGTCAATDSVLIPATGNISVTLSNTWAGSVAFSLTQDNKTYASVTATQGTSLTSSTTTNGTWILPLGTGLGFCLSFSSYTSGSATVSLNPAPATPTSVAVLGTVPTTITAAPTDPPTDDQRQRMLLEKIYAEMQMHTLLLQSLKDSGRPSPLGQNPTPVK